MTDLEYRILEISWKHKLSHIGSCIGAAPILDEIYTKRKKDDPVILSCGHAGLALYAVLEKYHGVNAEELFRRHGVHPNKSVLDEIFCSSGSLGQGITVAVGRALADRTRDVWCLISDGECAEGAVYEALRFAGEHHLTNLRTYCFWNGYGAYREVMRTSLQVRNWCPWVQERGIRPDGYRFPFLSGQEAHYYVMTQKDWDWVQTEKAKNTQ